MSGSIVVAEDLEVPLDVGSLAGFRRWALFDEFPERGRIDYIDGHIEVEVSPEDIFGHGVAKGELIAVLASRVKSQKSGDLLGWTRMFSTEANLSAEPDILFFSHESRSIGRVELIPHVSGKPGRYVGLDGGPDLIVEVVSDYTAIKDTTRLPVAYFTAGVREFWLVDARKEELVFCIHRRGHSGFEPVEVADDGFQRSEVMQCGYRLSRTRGERGCWEFDLLEKPA